MKAKQNGYQFILEVRPGAKLSGPLQEAIKNGEIILKYIGQQFGGYIWEDLIKEKLIQEVREKGVEITNINDLMKINMKYRDLVPILLKLLE